MLRLLTTIFLISTGIFVYSYFRELNPGTITVTTGPSTRFELSAVTLVAFRWRSARYWWPSPSARQTVHVIGNWRSTRLQRRKEKVDALHREGTHAFMSKRTSDAVGLFEKRFRSIRIGSTHCYGWETSIALKPIMPKPFACIRMHTASTTGISRFFSNWRKTSKGQNDMRRRSRRCKRFSDRTG